MATIFSSRLIRHEICMDELKKLGAEVVDMNGVMTFVKFRFETIDLSYIYHLNKGDTYFLERISPYTVAVGRFPREEAVIDSIAVDIEQFRNAMNSKNFMGFVEVNQSLSQIVKLFEDLYLYYNIDREDLAQLNRESIDLIKNIMAIRKRSQRVYFRKEPDLLNEDFEKNIPE